MQQVNIKIFADKAEGVNISDAIPVFHRWIQKSDLPEMLIDVADYAHVPGGPGVLLIAHEANYSLDFGQNRLGLLYNRKAGEEGTPPEQLRQAYDSAVKACERIEQEPEFRGKLGFNRGDVELLLNDRLLYPNTDERWQEIKPEVTTFFDGVFGAGCYGVSREGSARERLRVQIRKT